jgi:hypothetical protein
MMEHSVFMDQSTVPGDQELLNALKGTYELWQSVREYVHQLYPGFAEEWNYSGKFGWRFRIRDKKRILVYLLPREAYFKTAFVFGQKATESILDSNIADSIKETLQSSKVYAEGRGIRIDVRDPELLDDLKALIRIKLEN